MIKLDNQFVYSFQLGEVRDFINVYNLKDFKLFEQAGNCRPIVHLSFQLDNPDLVKYLNAGNILIISFGVSETEMVALQFELYGDNVDINRNLGYETTIRAAMHLPKFTNLVGSSFYPGMSSIDLIQKIAEENKLNLITNVSKTVDKQDWCREGQTLWEFMRDVWLGSYINDDTFMSYAIDSNNIYFYDMKKLSQETAKWLFSTDQITSNNTVNIAGITTKNNYGALAELVGKNLINRVYNIDTGEYSDVTYNLKSFTTIDTNKVNINSTNCKDYNYAVISNDVHPNYVKAWNQNLRNNLMYSSFTILTTTAGFFRKFRLLDTVRFDVQPKDERLAGISYITGITYQYEFGVLSINITLNKEAPSGMRGEALQEGA
jgi:hypothetical protein